MSTHDVAQLVTLLHGLFPNLTDEQARHWADYFERIADAGAVREAIRRHYVESPKIDPPALRGAIATELQRRGPLDRARPSPDQVEQRLLEEHFEEVDARVATLSDEQLEKIRGEVLAAARPEVRDVLARLNPRRSRSLKEAIFARLTGAA